MKRFIPCLFLMIFVAATLSGCLMYNLYANTNTDEESDVQHETLPDIDGNPYTTHYEAYGETVVSYDYTAAYETIDLSQYSDWGSFGEDGIMWVKKSDYKGTLYGYIDYLGNVVVPLTEEIVSPGQFENGYAIVACEYDVMRNGIYAVINTKGETVLEFENHAISLHYQSSNGNIVFIDINLIEDMYSSETKDYILCSNTGKVVEIVEEACSCYSPRSMVYSNGLLRTYRTDWDTPNKNNDVGYIEVVTFYDENGVEALRIDTNSSEYYKSLLYVEDFVDEKSVVYFWGLDRNYYKVQIDKSGKWVSEPVKIDKEQAQRF